MPGRLVHAGCCGVECDALVGGRGPVVVFLHGYSFRYRVWVDSGSIDVVENAGYSWAAPDMPYGRLTSCTRRTGDVDVNLGVAMEAFRAAGGGEAPLVVGASLGGRYAIYLAEKLGSRALLLVAPALAGDEAAWSILRGLGKRGVKVTVVWGTRDAIIPRKAAEEAARAAGGVFETVEGAGHVVHLDSPAVFNEILERAALEAARGARG